jgi:hypothetical protein
MGRTYGGRGRGGRHSSNYRSDLLPTGIAKNELKFGLASEARPGATFTVVKDALKRYLSVEQEGLSDLANSVKKMEYIDVSAFKPKKSDYDSDDELIYHEEVKDYIRRKNNFIRRKAEVSRIIIEKFCMKGLVDRLEQRYGNDFDEDDPIGLLRTIRIVMDGSVETQHWALTNLNIIRKVVTAKMRPGESVVE